MPSPRGFLAGPGSQRRYTVCNNNKEGCIQSTQLKVDDRFYALPMCLTLLKKRSKLEAIDTFGGAFLKPALR